MKILLFATLFSATTATLVRAQSSAVASFNLGNIKTDRFTLSWTLKDQANHAETIVKIPGSPDPPPDIQSPGDGSVVVSALTRGVSLSPDLKISVSMCEVGPGGVCPPAQTSITLASPIAFPAALPTFIGSAAATSVSLLNDGGAPAANPGYTKVVVESSLSRDFSVIFSSAEGSESTPAVLGGLSPDTCYFYRTYAVNLGGIPTTPVASAECSSPRMDNTLPHLVACASNGVSLNLAVPAGAVSSPFVLYCNPNPQSSYFDAALAAKIAGASVLGGFSTLQRVADVRLLDSAGGALGAGAAASINFTNTSTAPARSMYFAQLYGAAWLRVPNGTANSASVSGNGTYAIVTQGLTTLSNAYAFPVPFRPSTGDTTITFGNLAAVTHIKIFTIAGRLVRSIEENDGDGIAVWDVTNSAGAPVASGVYLYTLDSDTDHKQGKLMIVR
jgi:hypothetical protein